MKNSNILAWLKVPTMVAALSGLLSAALFSLGFAIVTPQQSQATLAQVLNNFIAQERVCNEQTQLLIEGLIKMECLDGDKTNLIMAGLADECEAFGFNIED